MKRENSSKSNQKSGDVRARPRGDGKVYLLDEQVEMMDALNEHVKATDKMERFTFGSGGRIDVIELQTPPSQPANIA